MKRNKKTYIIIAIILLLLLGASYVVYRYSQSNAEKSTSETTLDQKGTPEVAQSTKDSTSQENNTEQNKSSNSQENSNTEAPSSTGEIPGGTLLIKSFEQSSGTIKATAIINSNETGTCYFGFSSSGTKPVSRTNQSKTDASNQICSVEIPEVEFTKLGQWNMLISFTKNNAKVENSQNVTIN